MIVYLSESSLELLLCEEVTPFSPPSSSANIFCDFSNFCFSERMGHNGGGLQL